MTDWLLLALLGFLVVLVLALGTRVIARSWYDEKRRHLRQMLGHEDQNSFKESKHDELER